MRFFLPPCNACDNCLEKENATKVNVIEDLWFLLKTMATAGTFGFGTYIEILFGSTNKKIRDRRLAERCSSTYGKAIPNRMTKSKNWWKRFANFCKEMGYIKEEMVRGFQMSYTVFKPSFKGFNFLRKFPTETQLNNQEIIFELPMDLIPRVTPLVRRDRGPSKTIVKYLDILSDEEKSLFEKLHVAILKTGLRAFPAASVAEAIKRRTSCKVELLSVTGMTEQKLDQFGEVLLKEIKDWCTVNNEDFDQLQEGETDVSEEAQDLFKLLDETRSTIAASKGVKKNDVIANKHLMRLAIKKPATEASIEKQYGIPRFKRTFGGDHLKLFLRTVTNFINKKLYATLDSEEILLLENIRKVAKYIPVPSVVEIIKRCVSCKLEFCSVDGMTESKWQQYGENIIELVKSYCVKIGLPHDQLTEEELKNDEVDQDLYLILDWIRCDVASLNGLRKNEVIANKHLMRLAVRRPSTLDNLKEQYGMSSFVNSFGDAVALRFLEAINQFCKKYALEQKSTKIEDLGWASSLLGKADQDEPLRQWEAISEFLPNRVVNRDVPIRAKVALDLLQSEPTAECAYGKLLQQGFRCRELRLFYGAAADALPYLVVSDPFLDKWDAWNVTQQQKDQVFKAMCSMDPKDLTKLTNVRIYIAERTGQKDETGLIPWENLKICMQWFWFELARGTLKLTEEDPFQINKAPSVSTTVKEESKLKRKLPGFLEKEVTAKRFRAGQTPQPVGVSGGDSKPSTSRFGSSFGRVAQPQNKQPVFGAKDSRVGGGTPLKNIKSLVLEKVKQCSTGVSLSKLCAELNFSYKEVSEAASELHQNFEIYKKESLYYSL